MDEIPHNYPWYFEDLFHTLNTEFPTLTKEQKIAKWNKVKEDYEWSFQSLNFELEEDLLNLTSPQARLVKDVNTLYKRYKKELFSRRRGGSMLGFSRERETTNGNLRMVGESSNSSSDESSIDGGKISRPKNPEFYKKNERDNALEEEFEFPYRFTNEFIDRVEEVHDLINDNGDYERARDLFAEYEIQSIWRHDYQRLRRDLRRGMDLDEEDEALIEDLKNLIESIVDELKQHFGKRRKGGKLKYKKYT